MAVQVEQRPVEAPTAVPAAPIVEAQAVDKRYETGKVEVHALRREREQVRQALREGGARFREYAAGAAETT